MITLIIAVVLVLVGLVLVGLAVGPIVMIGRRAPELRADITEIDRGRRQP